MILSEITDYLEEVAPLRFQESYDNAGLIVGESDMEVTGVVVSLDATEAVVHDAIEQGCNVVISHHPIVFRGIKKFNHNYYVDKAVISAINGVNEKIAQKLNLSNVRSLRPHPSTHLETAYQVGSGAMGRMSESLDGEAFIAYLKSKMGLKLVRHTRLLENKVSNIAICGGAGSFLLPSAISAGADVFITADYKYHEFFDANDEIVIMDIGHYESEYYTIELLIELLSKKFPNFAPHYTKVVTNPVYYS